MAFSGGTISDAWDRQEGQCAYCCKTLVWDNCDYGLRGAWHAHHRRLLSYSGTDSLRNCVILCINEPEDCHFNVGHGGVSWDHYAARSDDDFSCLSG